MSKIIMIRMVHKEHNQDLSNLSCSSFSLCCCSCPNLSCFSLSILSWASSIDFSSFSSLTPSLPLAAFLFHSSLLFSACLNLASALPIASFITATAEFVSISPQERTSSCSVLFWVLSMIKRSNSSIWDMSELLTTAGTDLQLWKCWEE